METLNEQLFSADFILDYIKNDTGRKRFLTYTVFRFFSFAGMENEALPSLLKEKLGYSCQPNDFSVLEDFLDADDYFAPSLLLDSFDTIFLCDAIYLVSHTGKDNQALLDELLSSLSPVAAGLSYTDANADFSTQLLSGKDFYAALCIAATHYEETFPSLLPKFTTAYREDFRFTCGDFILYDFMDEYFEQKNARLHPSFIELTDTLVAATLNYFNTDFGTLVETELASCLDGSSARLAGTKRCGSVQFPALRNSDRACRQLAGLFRYAAVYELRSNLFDFHLEDDKLITLTNWKEKLRWHYVQYANVYNMALSTFYSAQLSHRLLELDFMKCLAALR